MTIRAVLIVNNHGKPRLTKFYSQLPVPRQQALIRQIWALVCHRNTEAVCNFLDAPELTPLLPPAVEALNFSAGKQKGAPGIAAGTSRTKGKEKASTDDGDDLRVIYRHYATLYFVFVTDTSESELGILDLIQVFVESLDRCFENVCELDLIFHFDEVHAILSEVIQGGLVLETNINEIVSAAKTTSQARKASASSTHSGSGLSSFGPAPPGSSSSPSLGIPGSPGWATRGGRHSPTPSGSFGGGGGGIGAGDAPWQIRGAGDVVSRLQGSAVADWARDLGSRWGR